jgi:hypothetical protein
MSSNMDKAKQEFREGAAHTGQAISDSAKNMKEGAQAKLQDCQQAVHSGAQQVSAKAADIRDSTAEHARNAKNTVQDKTANALHNAEGAVRRE